MDDAARLRKLAERAIEGIQPGMIVGLGSGSTAEAMVRVLGGRVATGLDIVGVTTSQRTAHLAESLDIRLESIDIIDAIDVCIDGADEIDPQLNVVKGRGGALLWEKLTARRAKHYIIIASAEKKVERLGTRMPLPVEIVPYGWKPTASSLEPLGLIPALRRNADGTPFQTDGHHYIVDCEARPINDPAALATEIKALTGVVDHGLFVGMANEVMTVDASGEIEVRTRR